MIVTKMKFELGLDFSDNMYKPVYMYYESIPLNLLRDMAKKT